MSANGPKPTSRGAGQRAYHSAVRGFSAVSIAIGLALLVVTLANGGGPASVGVLMGVVFVAVGAGRLWIASRMEQ